MSIDTFSTSPFLDDASTASPSDTSLASLSVKQEPEPKSDTKKPAKKRKSWGQELPVPKTNLPPRCVTESAVWI